MPSTHRSCLFRSLQAGGQLTLGVGILHVFQFLGLCYFVPVKKVTHCLAFGIEIHSFGKGECSKII